MKIEPLSDVLGAAVSGVDLGGPVAPEIATALDAALTEHLVLCIRGQDLEPPAFAAASRLF